MGSTSDRAALNALALAFIACFFLLARVHGPRLFFIGEGDDESYFAYARSLLIDHDLNFRNEPLPTFAGNPRAEMQAARYAMGPGILWLPFLATGHFISRLIGVAPDIQIREGITSLDWISACVGSMLYAFAGLLLLYLFLRKWFEPDITTWAVLLTHLSSPWLYYVFRRPLMSHAIEYFALAGGLYFISRLDDEDPWVNAIFSGLMMGFLFICRWMDAPYVAGLGFWAAFQLMRNTGRWFNAPIFLVAGTSGLVACCQLAVWKHLTGFWYPGIRMFDLGIIKSSVIFAWYPWSTAHLKDLWLGMDWGILWLSPILWLTLPALALERRRWMCRDVQAVLILPTLVAFVIASNWPSHGGDYGNRYLIATWVLWTYLFARLMTSVRQDAPRLMKPLLMVSCACAAYSLLMLSMFKSNATTLTLHVGPTRYGLASDWINNEYAVEAAKELVRHPITSVGSFASSPAGYFGARAFSHFQPNSKNAMFRTLSAYFVKHTPPALSSWLFLLVFGLLGVLILHALALRAAPRSTSFHGI